MSDTIGGLDIHSVDKRLNYINFLVYGSPGVGKTVLAGSADAVPEMRPVLIIDVEGGTLSLNQFAPEVDVVRVETWNDMQLVYKDLHAGEHGYKTVVLDSLTEIQKFSMYNIMQKLIKKDPNRDPDIPGLQDWGKNIEQMRRLVRLFRDLPMHTIFTALDILEKDGRTGITQARPSMSGKLSTEVAGFVDIVGWLHAKQDGKEMKRRLTTLGGEDAVAKDRSGKLPPIIESPDMQTIYDYITE